MLSQAYHKGVDTDALRDIIEKIRKSAYNPIDKGPYSTTALCRTPSREKMIFKIYSIINIVNRKIYVGKTSKTIEQRWQSHVDNANCNQRFYFYRAIRKYDIVRAS
jgi:hypothetical protein